MDGDNLQQSSNLEEFLWILLPIGSIMHMDEGLIKNLARFVKNLDEKWEKIFEEILELDLDLRILLC